MSDPNARTARQQRDRLAAVEALRAAADDIIFDLGRGYTGADDAVATCAAAAWLRARADNLEAGL